MIDRADFLRRLETAVARSPITALLGPRQCGKTTLARRFASTREAAFFDLESEPDVRRLANPELVLGELRGLVVLDEIQRRPGLFNALRVLADRPDRRSRSSSWAACRRTWCAASRSRWRAAWNSSN